MTAIASMTLTDGTTPVTLYPIAVSPTAIYKDTSNAVVPDVGQKTCEVSIKPGKGNAATHVRIVLRHPFMETPSGGTGAGYEAAPAVAFSGTAVVDFWLPKRMTPAQKTLLRKYLISGLGNAQIVDTVDNFTPPL